jgi:hypothetical protein
VLTDDIVLVVHFLVRRLSVDNRGPNHPVSYDQAILDSGLFKPEVFGKVMVDPLEDPGAQSRPDRCARSKLKIAFISFLGEICSNDPAQIPKLIDKGHIGKVVETLKQGLPIHRRTINVMVDFIRVLVVHERGKQYVKDNGLFELLMNPLTQNDDKNYAFVFLASNQEKYKMHNHHAMSGIIRSADPYF